MGDLKFSFSVKFTLNSHKNKYFSLIFIQNVDFHPISVRIS